jgi:hypothetical protein
MMMSRWQLPFPIVQKQPIPAACNSFENSFFFPASVTVTTGQRIATRSKGVNQHSEKSAERSAKNAKDNDCAISNRKSTRSFKEDKKTTDWLRLPYRAQQPSHVCKRRRLRGAALSTRISPRLRSQPVEEV